MSAGQLRWRISDCHPGWVLLNSSFSVNQYFSEDLQSFILFFGYIPGSLCCFLFVAIAMLNFLWEGSFWILFNTPVVSQWSLLVLMLFNWKLLPHLLERARIGVRVWSLGCYGKEMRGMFYKNWKKYKNFHQYLSSLAVYICHDDFFVEFALLFNIQLMCFLFCNQCRGVSAISFSKQRSRTFTSGTDGMICEIDFLTGNLVQKFRGSTKAISSMAISPGVYNLLISFSFYSWWCCGNMPLILSSLVKNRA